MRLFLSLLVLFSFIMLADAQEESQTPYEIALQRIQEAEANGTEELDLSGLGLQELPPEIGNMINLEILLLGDNQLNSFPSEIGKLSNLQGLDLSNNQLTSLPAAIGNLRELQSLNLADNSLSSLPPEVGNLSTLYWLYIANNQLTSLPPEFGKLRRLRYLYLNNNQLNSLPVEFSNLSELCFLDLTANRFQSIPLELHPLNGLETGEKCQFIEGLVLDENLLDTLPEDVANGGTSAILHYLENEAWWHFQRMVVSAAAMIAVPCAVILAWRWKNRRGKRKNSEKAKVQS